jgi:hypothetical protein
VARDLAINLVAAVILVFFLYFRRHRRRDLVLGLMAFNLSLFVVSASLASSSAISIGVGFGLFAVLSIVRLRSDEASQAEIGFTMVSLVLGLINGLPTLGVEFKILFSVVLVAGMYVVDHRMVLSPDKYRRFFVSLDKVITDPQELRKELEEALQVSVNRALITSINLRRQRMVVDVRVRGKSETDFADDVTAPTEQAK